jgi:hypothetical protein
MSAHTPGPWLIDTEDRDICVQLPNGDWLSVATVGCMDHNGVKYWFGPDSWANACLLRSAPDLLGALEALAEYVDRMHQVGHIQRPQQSSDAYAAIAKAKGEQPPLMKYAHFRSRNGYLLMKRTNYLIVNGVIMPISGGVSIEDLEVPITVAGYVVFMLLMSFAVFLICDLPAISS